MTRTCAPDVNDGGRTSFAPTCRPGADQPPRTAAAFAADRVGRGVGRGAARRVAVGTGRGVAVRRGVTRGVGRGAVRVVVDPRGAEPAVLEATLDAEFDADGDGDGAASVGDAELDIVGVGLADDVAAARTGVDVNADAGDVACADGVAVPEGDALLVGSAVG